MTTSQQAAANRRGATRVRANDENALPSQALRNKASLSALGPAQKSVMAVQPVKKAGGVSGTKVGAKRTALGGVVGNGVKEEEFKDEKPGNSITYCGLKLSSTTVLMRISPEGEE